MKPSSLTPIQPYRAAFETLICQRLGIVISTPMRSELDRIVLEGCQRFNFTPAEYLTALTTCNAESPLLEYLITRVTIGESYFFRDEKQMTLLSQSVLPEIIAKKRHHKNLSLRIWSAGASSGEEIYSIAIMLNELLSDFNNWKIQLLATDINTILLNKATKAHYKSWSMRTISNYFKSKYFSEKQNEYVLVPKIRNLVKFSYLNLNTNTYPSIFNGTNTQDLILCRNVLIYFDTDLIESLMSKFYQSLIPGGYLLLGASDPVLYKNVPFIYHYKKGMLFSRALREKNTALIPTVLTGAPRKSQTIKCKPIKKVTIYSLVEEVKKLLQNEQWQKILDVLILAAPQEINIPFLLNAKATALANIGKLDSALAVCQEGLRVDSTDKYIYFTYALILAELNKYSEAENALRKSLFLDHQFAIAHFQLGLLLIRNKQKATGIKSLKNAWKIALTQDPTQEVPGAIRMTYGKLTDILKHELELYTELGNHNESI